MTESTVLIKYYLKYIILLLIFKNINILLPSNFDDFGGVYALIYILIAYLVVKYIFIYDLEKNKYLKRKYLLPVVIGYTLLNFILKMPLLYNIFIIIFLIYIKEKPVIDKEKIEKNIKEYYNNKNEDK